MPHAPCNSSLNVNHLGVSSQGSENILEREAVLPSLYRHVFLVRVLDPVYLPHIFNIGESPFVLLLSELIGKGSSSC